MDPEDRHLDLWEDRPRRSEPKTTGAAAGGEVADLSAIGRVLVDEFKLPRGIAGENLLLLEKAGMGPDEARDFVFRVKGESDALVACGTQKVRHCGYLLRHQLSALVKREARPALPWEGDRVRGGLAEVRPKLGERFESGVFARTFVGVDRSRSLFPWNLHRHDLETIYHSCADLSR